MRIAVASEGQSVTEHFGHCEGFAIFETENQEIIGREFVASPGHRPGFLPNFLYSKGVDVIIAGGMGGGAVEIFQQKGIEIITGASGEAVLAAKKYLQGELKSSESVCHQHKHAGDCDECE